MCGKSRLRRNVKGTKRFTGSSAEVEYLGRRLIAEPERCVLFGSLKGRELGVIEYFLNASRWSVVKRNFEKERIDDA